MLFSNSSLDFIHRFVHWHDESWDYNHKGRYELALGDGLLKDELVWQQRVNNREVGKQTDEARARGLERVDQAVDRKWIKEASAKNHKVFLPRVAQQSKLRVISNALDGDEGKRANCANQS